MMVRPVKIKVIYKGGAPLYVISGGHQRTAVRTRDGKTAEEVAGARARVIAKRRAHRMGFPSRLVA